MKVGVFSFVFQDLLSYDDALDWIAGTGAQAIEVGSGGYVAELGESYCKPAELLEDENKLKDCRRRPQIAGWRSVP